MAMQDSDNDRSSTAPKPENGAGSQPAGNKESRRLRSGFAAWCRSNLWGGIVSGLISGAILTFVITATGHSTGLRILQIAGEAKPPSCNDPGWLLRVPDDQILGNSWYAARDTLPYYKTLHTPDLTVDDNLRSAWLQWWPTDAYSTSASSGNYITWSFAQEYDIRLVCILNGWDEDSATFNSVDPVKYATIGYAAPGCAATRVKLSIHTYTYSWNPAKLSRNHPTRSLCLQIREPYPENKKNKKQLHCTPGPKDHKLPCRPLTGISEVRFYYSPSPLDWVSY